MTVDGDALSIASPEGRSGYDSYPGPRPGRSTLAATRTPMPPQPLRGPFQNWNLQGVVVCQRTQGSEPCELPAGRRSPSRNRRARPKLLAHFSGDHRPTCHLKVHFYSVFVTRLIQRPANVTSHTSNSPLSSASSAKETLRRTIKRFLPPILSTTTKRRQLHCENYVTTNNTAASRCITEKKNGKASPRGKRTAGNPPHHLGATSDM